GGPRGHGARLRRLHADQSLANPGGVLLEGAGGGAGRLWDAHRVLWKCGIGGATSETSVRSQARRRRATASRKDITQRRRDVQVFARRLCVTSLCYVFCVTSLVSQRPQPFDQQLRDNQQRLEGIRRERSEVAQELERMRTHAHSSSDELSNIERQ